MSGPAPEPQVEVASSRPLWLALLAGPSLWFGHFMAVYLLLEVVCAGAVDGTRTGVVRGALTAITLLVLLVLAVAAQQTAKPLPEADGMEAVLLRVGIALDAFFAVSVLVVAAPVVVLPSC